MDSSVPDTSETAGPDVMVQRTEEETPPGLRLTKSPTKGAAQPITCPRKVSLPGSPEGPEPHSSEGRSLHDGNVSPILSCHTPTSTSSFPPSPCLAQGLENGPSASIGPLASNGLTPKLPKKRGRKSKAELLLIRMSQEVESQACHAPAESVPEEEELTASGRPRRRAAKTAMRYLQDIAAEWEGLAPVPVSPQPVMVQVEETGQKRRRKRKAGSSDEEDVDFVVSREALLSEEVEDECLSEESEEDVTPYKMSVFSHGEKPNPMLRGFAENGFHNTIMAPAWASAQTTLEYRDVWHSDWEFPDWVPYKDSWRLLSASAADTYLPEQSRSAPFSIRREGIEEDGDPCELGRFQSLPPHPERWDVTFFVGGPVWSLEWCPTVEGSGSCQYVALYSHRGMDDRHRLDVTHTGPALLQVWNLGALGLETGAGSAASFCYGLALDDGCVWDMKFCPSGGWEPPRTLRKSTDMPRMGLLATAFSSGHVAIYSLPHPEPLSAHRRSHGTETTELAIYKVDCVVRLHVGSIRAGDPGDNGQCFTVAWLPSKPHQYVAAGFYDGTVSIWDLKTKSVLQKVRQGRVIKQYPFQSFSAHDHAVRGIEWCKADSNFLVTSSNDRHLKFWDLRRLYSPVRNIKRFQSTEIAWLLPYCGVVVAQDNSNASQGLCGIHYVDSGFLGYKPYFVTPRGGTVWSVSGSDWLSTITAGDINGEVMAIILPALNVQSVNTKRPSERRFPIYKADFLPYDPHCGEGHHADMKPSGTAAESQDWDHFKPKSFRAAIGRFSLLFQDMDLRTFRHLHNREPVKRMQANETKGDQNIERVQLEAIHKARFSPNLDSYPWIVSGGHSGLVRIHCVQGLVSSMGRKIVKEKRASFQAMFQDMEMAGENDYVPEVKHCVVRV